MKTRSLLYTPAYRLDRVEKAWTKSIADLVIADLEDATPPNEKANARQGLIELLARLGPTSKDTTTLRGIRIQAIGAEGHDDDVATVLAAKPDVVVLPKAEHVDEVRGLCNRLQPAGIPVIIILETPLGVHRAFDLCSAHPAILGACFGAEDLAAAAGMTRSHSNWEIQKPRQMTLLQILAAGKIAFDMITSDFSDDERLERETQEAKALGFHGRMCIHPKQVEVIHEIYAPSPEELDAAKRLVEAAAKAGIEEGGVLNYEGRMIDRPLIEQAKRILRNAP